MLDRRSLLLGLSGLPLAAALRPAFAAVPVDSLSTSLGEVGIHPVRHAGLVLTLGDTALYFDPTGGPALFDGLPPPTAILVTHAHGDHFEMATLGKLAGETVPIITTEEVHGRLPAALKARTTVLRNGESGEAAGLTVDAVPAYNTTEARKKYHPQGVGNGYVVNFGDRKVYVAGDTEDTPEMRALTNIDVAFLPMTLPYTMSAQQLVDAVVAFRPAVVYPYHYQGAKRDKLAELIGDASEVRLADWYGA